MAAKAARKMRKAKETPAPYVAGPAPLPDIYRTAITSKGQVVIPAALRQKYGITPETRLIIYDDGEVIVLKPVTPSQLIEELHGSLAGSGTMQDYLAEKAKEIEREDADLRRPR
jgi:AbrB family looped-hinge helix DNA binding protein